MPKFLSLHFIHWKVPEDSAGNRLPILNMLENGKITGRKIKPPRTSRGGRSCKGNT